MFPSSVHASATSSLWHHHVEQARREVETIEGTWRVYVAASLLDTVQAPKKEKKEEDEEDKAFKVTQSYH